jgi:hypothetical protein
MLTYYACPAIEKVLLELLQQQLHLAHEPTPGIPPHPTHPSSLTK